MVVDAHDREAQPGELVLDAVVERFGVGEHTLWRSVEPDHR